MSITLEYYFEDGSHIKFDQYMIDANGVVKNKKTCNIVNVRNRGKYNGVRIRDNNGKQREILVGRAISSTFHGKPPTLEHTADHIDRNPINDILDNIRWLCKSGQAINRTMPEANKSALIVSRYGQEKTVKEWVEFLRSEKNPFGREYTATMINMYAIRKQYGFSYKEYPDLPGEVWKEIVGSKTNTGHWKISDMNRVKYITKYAENVLSGGRLGIASEYPTIGINGKRLRCHVLAFQTFFPDRWASKKPEEMVLHENDDKADFRPHKLRLGTYSENGTDAHSNGCHDGTKRMRMSCASYVNDVLEKEYISQSDAVRYLSLNGHPKATCGEISKALKNFR